MRDATLHYVPETQQEVSVDANSCHYVLRSYAEGGHSPTVFYYKSLFEIEDHCDLIENFDPSQDKIDLSELFLSLGGDMGIENIKTHISPDGSLELTINDGPAGIDGAFYHFLTLKAFPQHHKASLTKKILAGFIRV